MMNGKFHILDMAMKDISVTRVDATCCVAILRSTWMVREHLAYWDELLVDVYNNPLYYGYDPEMVLTGLLDHYRAKNGNADLIIRNSNP